MLFRATAIPLTPRPADLQAPPATYAMPASRTSLAPEIPRRRRILQAFPSHFQMGDLALSRDHETSQTASQLHRGFCPLMSASSSRPMLSKLRIPNLES